MNENLHIENILDDLLKNKVTRPVAVALLTQEDVKNPDFEIDLHMSAVNGIQRYNILSQVQLVHDRFVAARTTMQSGEKYSSGKTAVNINLVKWMVGVAASIVLVFSVWFLYQYSNTSSSSLYSEIYQPYNINTDRGGVEIKTHNMVEEFKQNNYKAVIKIFESLSLTNNREKFLAGYAYQQEGNFQQSVLVYQQILSYNQKTGTRLYNDEAEFYSGLSFLKLNDNVSAANIFESIGNNPSHTFYERISKRTLTKLKWLK